MFEEIIKDLPCTKEEFEEYYNSLVLEEVEIEHNIYTFDQKYNGCDIENRGNGKYYYTLQYGEITYLQDFVPFVNGFNPLNDDNIQEVILEHKNYIKGNIEIKKKIELTILHFKQ